jgi:hypothetical protein
VSLQLHRPDGRGGIEQRPVKEPNWRRQLLSPRWGSGRRNSQLPELGNREMNPVSTLMSVAFWVSLAVLTFVILVIGYGTGFWSVPITPSPPP